jgi:hypothetical protein
MTVSTQSSSVTYIGNGSTTSFTFPFIGVSSSDIEVVYTDTNGTETILSPSQYTLVLNTAPPGSLWGIGGTVTYPASGNPIVAGSQLTINRTVPLTQTISINNQGAFYPQAVEQAIDLICLELQQIANRTGQFRGTWATDIYYNYGDVVVDGANGADTGNYYMCVSANTSGTWSTDLSNGDWVIFLNLQSLVPTTNNKKYSKTITSSYTVQSTDGIIDVDASAGTITITFPISAGSASQTQEVTISKIDTSSNVIIISDGTNNVDAISTAASSNGQINGWRSVYSNGTNIRSLGVG